MPTTKTVQQSFDAAKQGLVQINYNLNLLKALCSKVITENADPTLIGKIEDFVNPAADSPKWYIIVNGVKDIFQKMALRGAGTWNDDQSSPALADATMANTFDFQAGCYSAYKAPMVVSLGNVSLNAFYDTDTTFESRDSSEQIALINTLIEELDSVVSVYGDLDCNVNF